MKNSSNSTLIRKGKYIKYYMYVILGGVLTVLGLFFPWVKTNFYRTTGFQGMGEVAYLIVFGAIVIIILSLIGLRKNKNFWILITIINSSIILYFFFFQYLHDFRMDKIQSNVFFAEFGIGIIISSIGSLTSFISGLSLFQHAVDNNRKVVNDNLT